MLWLILYSAFFIIAALTQTRLKSGAEEFFVRGKNASPLAVAFSLLAACVGGSATVGMIGLSAEVGFPAFWWLGSGCFGLLGLALLLAKKVRASGALTMPQILENILGRRFRIGASFVILAAWIAILAAQINALGLIISDLCSFNYFRSCFHKAL